MTSLTWVFCITCQLLAHICLKSHNTTRIPTGWCCKHIYILWFEKLILVKLEISILNQFNLTLGFCIASTTFIMFRFQCWLPISSELFVFSCHRLKDFHHGFKSATDMHSAHQNFQGYSSVTNAMKRARDKWVVRQQQQHVCVCCTAVAAGGVFYYSRLLVVTYCGNIMYKIN